MSASLLKKFRFFVVTSRTNFSLSDPKTVLPFVKFNLFTCGKSCKIEARLYSLSELE